jgi:hypothetical protein
MRLPGNSIRVCCFSPPQAYVYVTVVFEDLFHALCFTGYATEVRGYAMSSSSCPETKITDFIKTQNSIFVMERFPGNGCISAAKGGCPPRVEGRLLICVP